MCTCVKRTYLAWEGRPSHLGVCRVGTPPALIKKPRLGSGLSSPQVAFAQVWVEIGGVQTSTSTRPRSRNRIHLRNPRSC